MLLLLKQVVKWHTPQIRNYYNLLLQIHLKKYQQNYLVSLIQNQHFQIITINLGIQVSFLHLRLPMNGYYIYIYIQYFSLLIRLDVVQNKVRKSLSDYLNRILPLQSYLHIQECIIDDNPKSIEAIGELIRENQSQIFDLLPYSCQVGGFLIQMDELIQTINFTI